MTSIRILRRGFVRSAFATAVAATAALVAVGHAHAAATPAGVQNAAGVSVLEHIACPPKGKCIAVGRTYASGGGIAHDDIVPVSAGKPGAAVDPGDGVFLTGVACADDNLCWVTGQRNSEGVVIKVVKGTPGSPKPVKGTFSLFGITCGTASSCWATGDEPNHNHPVVVHLQDGSPTVYVQKNNNNDLLFSAGEGGNTGLHCRTATKCTFLGNSQQSNGQGPGLILTFNDGKQTSEKKVSGVGTFTSLGCSSDTNCTAAGQAPSNDGTGPGVITDGVPGNVRKAAKTYWLSGAACANWKHCVAVGFFQFQPPQAAVVRIKAGSIESVRHPFQGSLQGVACDPDTCWAVGSTGDYPDSKGIVYTLTP